MRKTNTRLFGKFISNNLAAFSKSQWRYPAGTLLLCSVASAAYYYAEQSKKIIADKNQDLKPVEIKDCEDTSSETSPCGLRQNEASLKMTLDEFIARRRLIENQNPVPTGIYTASGEFIPPEKVDDYFRAMGIQPASQEDAERMRRFFEYKESLPQPPQGLVTASGEYIPPEKVSEYFEKIRGRNNAPTPKM